MIFFSKLFSIRCVFFICVATFNKAFLKRRVFDFRVLVKCILTVLIQCMQFFKHEKLASSDSINDIVINPIHLTNMFKSRYFG